MLWLAARVQRPAVVSTRASQAERALARAEEYLDRRLAQPLSVPRLAEVVGLSQSHLARCFRARHGVTIPRYLLTRRVELAQQLLITTDLSIREIGRRVGWPDPQRFNKQFRRITGRSPSAFRGFPGFGG